MIRADEKQALVAEVLESDAWRSEMLPLLFKGISYHRGRVAHAVRMGDVTAAGREQGAVDGLVSYVESLYKYIKAEVPPWVTSGLCIGPDKA